MEEGKGGLGDFQHEEYEPSIAESNVRSVVSHSSFEMLLKQFKEYEPRSQMLNIEQLRQSSNLKLKKFKESAYYGQIVNGKRHGQGVMLYNSDRVYQGHWQNDYKHGTGYELFPNGSVYQGQYLNGKPEGVGKYNWANGEFYEGEWLNGVKHGSGMWQGVKGDSYVGEWRMGKAEGYGVHVWVNGDRYEGEFHNCLKHGQGTQRFANGDLYKGEYSIGKPNGYGEYYWANGSYFKGNFKQGLREGHGMWKKGSGQSDKYEGEYLGDRKHGYGIFSWASGNVYKGNYLEDFRHGYGEMFWGDGSHYKGEWQKGIQHGQGMLFVPGQGVKRGLFKDNVLVELLEEEILVTPPSPVQVPAALPRPGSIHKNSAVPPMPRGPPNQYRSVEGVRKRVVSVHDSQKDKDRVSLKASRELNPLIRKAGEKRVNKTANVAEMERLPTQATQPSIARSRDRIPHSAFYMHKLHKRVSTACNEDKQANRSKADIVDELRNFTKKMVGRRPL